MKLLKYIAVRCMDWVDDKIVGHRSYRVCHFIACTLEDWWPEDEWTPMEPES